MLSRRQKLAHALGTERASNEQLERAGFSPHTSPINLLNQIATLIDTPEEFKNILMTVPPENRRDAYESLVPRLKGKFEIKTLGQIEMEAHEYWGGVASREQGSLEAVAEQAIARDWYKGTLRMVCYRCLVEKFFFGDKKPQATKAAREAGWRYDRRKKAEICPACVRKMN